MNIISKPQTQAVFDNPKAATTAGRASKTTDSSTDQVDLGGQSGLLSQAQTASADSRAAHIERLRALVQSGQYEVDSKALSQAIVTSTLNGY